MQKWSTACMSAALLTCAFATDVLNRIALQISQCVAIAVSTSGDDRKPQRHTLDIQSGPECSNIALEILPVGYLLGSNVGISFLTSAKRLAALLNFSLASFFICTTLMA